MKIAVVHDWLDGWGGAESVLAELLQVFPGADVFTLVEYLSPAERSRLAPARIVTSSLQGLPWAQRWFRYAAVLWPQVVERFDLSGYDVVVSNSHAVAKGVRTHPGRVHVCYCHTPTRFAWTMAATYSERASGGASWRRPLVERALARFRDWDRCASERVDRFVANSRHIAATIARCYGRDADVVYPPVDVERFATAADAAGTALRTEYVTVSRLVPYKRIDVLVEAFRSMSDRRLVVIGDGPERPRLESLGVPNVEFAGAPSDADTARRVAGAKAFLIAAEEDFGIAPLEAQAAGTPVIAYGRGGALETIRALDRPAPTGVFFDAQTPDAVVAALRAFDATSGRISAAACQENARRFSAARFRAEIAQAVDAACAAPAHPRPVAEAA
jgi:glycosyltransferase involved in cell wall biosynthesis